MMPTLKRYQNKPGYYIHAQVEDSVITYQTTPKARQLFEEMGLAHGSSLPWTIINQLRERGDIYTEGSGIEFSDVDDDLGSLSPQQRSVYQMYIENDLLDSEFINKIDTVVESLVEESSYSLATRLKERLAGLGESQLIRYIEDFGEVPFQIEDVVVEQDSILYELTVQEDVSLICRDERLADQEHDFQGSIEYHLEEGTDATYKLRNGYFIEWSMDDGQQSDKESDVEERHTNAFKADFGLKSDLGFNLTNWTEVVRKLFLYVDKYDIRPYRRGHQGLCPARELEGKHIWVDTHTTTASSGDGSLLVTDEVVPIRLIGIEEPGPAFVKVKDIRNGQATAHQISYRTGL